VRTQARSRWWSNGRTTSSGGRRRSEDASDARVQGNRACPHQAGPEVSKGAAAGRGGPRGNPQARNLFEVTGQLQRIEGLHFELSLRAAS
jgi:hypothetical protein